MRPKADPKGRSGKLPSQSPRPMDRPMDPMDPPQNWVGTWDMGKTEKRPMAYWLMAHEYFWEMMIHEIPGLFEDDHVFCKSFRASCRWFQWCFVSFSHHVLLRRYRNYLLDFQGLWIFIGYSYEKPMDISGDKRGADWGYSTKDFRRGRNYHIFPKIWYI